MKRRIFLALLFFGTVVLTLLDGYFYLANRGFTPWMDDVIFEEFKGTGNMELHLERRMVDRRVYPAVDVNRSGTRKEELLYHKDELPRIHALRKVLSEESPVEAMGLLLEKIKKTENNIEFLMGMNVKK